MANPGFKRVLNYLWDSEPLNVDNHHQIVCLGVQYDPVMTGSGSDGDKQQKEESTVTSNGNFLWPAEFLEDVESKIWLTYRTNFALIPKAKDGPSPLNLGSILRGSSIDLNGFTSDVGWGCMIRTAQSLLANALILLNLGREWRKSDELLGEKGGDSNKLLTDKECEIISLFADEPQAPFSLHNMVKHGEESCGKLPGEWFGPSAAASSIKYLCGKNDLLQVYISEGSDLYSSEFLSIAKRDDGDWKPTLILLGLRLGIDNVNAFYWDSLRTFFDSSQMVGIAGGRPSASHYFYGYQGDSLFYLDPHIPRPKLESPVTSQDLETVHTKRIRMLRLDEMDPSMLVGFLIKNESDWEQWRSMIENNQKIIHILEAQPTIVRRSSISIDDTGGFVEFTLEDDDEDDDHHFPPQNNLQPRQEEHDNKHKDLQLHQQANEFEVYDNVDQPISSNIENNEYRNAGNLPYSNVQVHESGTCPVLSRNNIQESISIDIPVPESPVMISRSLESDYHLTPSLNSDDDDYDSPIIVSSSMAATSTTTTTSSSAIQDSICHRTISQEPVYVESPSQDDSEWEVMKKVS